MRVVDLVRSTQKFPTRLAPSACDPAHERDRDGDADGRGDEVLHGQAGQLGEMAHRRLAGVVLPVRVRDEADRRIEGERGRDAAGVGGVQREPALHALEQEEADDRDQAEREQRERVDLPWLLPLRVDPPEPVERALDRQEDAVTGSGAAAEDPRDVRAEQRRREEHEPQEGRGLRPRLPAHPRLRPDVVRISAKPLRRQERVDQVAEDEDREHQRDDVLEAHRRRSIPAAVLPTIRSHPATKAAATAKNPSVTPTNSRSRMPSSYRAPSGPADLS